MPLKFLSAIRMVTKLEEAAKAELHRQAGRRRKRLARQRAAAGPTAPAATAPLLT